MRQTALFITLGLLLTVVCPAAAHEVSSGSTFVTDKIQITGAVEHKLVLTVDDLKAFPLEDGGATVLTCQSGREIGVLEEISGVLLRDILSKAVVVAPAHNDVKKMVVIATASDGYKVVFSWSEIFNSPIGDGVIVYFEQQGKPLDDRSGRIALVSTKDIKTGPRRVKWLKEIEVRKIVE